MDPVTHFLTGACLGRSGFNRKTAYATLAMTLAAEAPDIDVIAGLGGPVTGFCRHRGITHTFLGAPLMALAVTGIVWAVARLRRGSPARPVRWAWIYGLCLLADASHLLLDYTNNYGLRPFFPFNSHWYAWSIVFIFEPVMFAALLGGLLLPALLALVDGKMRRPRPGQLRGRRAAIAALTVVGLLYGLRNAESLHAMTLLRQSDSAGREPLTRVAAEPVMADPFTWHTLSETRDGYRTAVVHTLSDRVDPGETMAKPPVTPAAAAAKQSYLGRVYGGWSSWPITEDIGPVAPPGDPAALPPGARTVVFRDARFAPPGEDTAPILAGYVVVGARGELLEQWMDGRRQP